MAVAMHTARNALQRLLSMHPAAAHDLWELWRAVETAVEEQADTIRTLQADLFESEIHCAQERQQLAESFGSVLKTLTIG